MMLSGAKSRRVAALLAIAGAVPIMGGFHLVGLHKLYLGQRWWCLIYIALAMTGSKAAWIAGIFDALFYLIQNETEFDANFNGEPLPESAATTPVKVAPMSTIADNLRDLDQLRQDGLITEYEFEQKRRKLLERIK
jgi:TM2 domain-containing membrane protein YozV